MSWSRRAPAKRSPIRPLSSTRGDEQHAADMQRRAELLAPSLGYCGSCGEVVDESRGRLHDAWCPDVAPERRKAKATR